MPRSSIMGHERRDRPSERGIQQRVKDIKFVDRREWPRLIKLRGLTARVFVSLALDIGGHRFAGVGPTGGNLAIGRTLIRFKQVCGAALCLLPGSRSDRPRLAYLGPARADRSSPTSTIPTRSALPIQSSGQSLSMATWSPSGRQPPRQNVGPADTDKNFWEPLEGGHRPVARCWLPRGGSRADSA